MEIKIALAGNPNSGKTTLFNALTGSNQFVGNWPGVTVEKKEGKLKKNDGVTVTDLPGIYSLSPYTLEEVVARNYLIEERPDAILNIVDATNLERNLYLTTQLLELGIPVVVALNMMDVVRKYGDRIDTQTISNRLKCKVVEISALKADGLDEAVNEVIKVAREVKRPIPMHIFSGEVEHAIAHIEEAVVHSLPDEQQRWYAIKVFERDEKVIGELNIDKNLLAHIEKDIVHVEDEFDDDADSIITNERYDYIAKILDGAYKKKNDGRLTPSEKIDKVLTHRIFALPIFALIMFIVYFVSVSTVGTFVTDWTNDGLFGDGFHLFGIGESQYVRVSEEYDTAKSTIDAFIAHANSDTTDAYEIDEKFVYTDESCEEFSEGAKTYLLGIMDAYADDFEVDMEVEDEETAITTTEKATGADFKSAIGLLPEGKTYSAPDPASYGVWVPGIPVLITNGLTAINCAPWLQSLIVDGIVAGVGAVLGFVPQILVLFIFLAFLEACGYMARIAFVLDRIFRKIGLSGKSFIPMLIGTGCSVPGIMASRTIENERDRRMTIMTTPFMPCGAKLPFIALIAGAVFGGAWWVAPSAYFVGMLAIIISGLMLKKTKAFDGEPAPFVMEVPAYHLPTTGAVLRSMWERGWSFIKKAGTVILLSTVVIWFLQGFGVVDGTFRILEESEVEYSILAYIGKGVAWLFAPIGFGEWQKAIATITGLVAKENIVGTLSILYGGGNNVGLAFNSVTGYVFLIFNLLCAPCFAAIGAIKREMNNIKWTLYAIGYQTCFAYFISFVVFHLGNLFTGAITNGWRVVGVVVAFLLIALMVFMLIRPDKKKKEIKSN